MPSPVIKPFLIPKSRASFKRDEYLESLHKNKVEDDEQ